MLVTPALPPNDRLGPSGPYWVAPPPKTKGFASRPGCLLLIVGVPIAIIASYLTIGLIASAWSACDDLEAGGRFELLFFFFPGVAVGSWVAFGLGSILTFRLRLLGGGPRGIPTWWPSWLPE